MGEWERGRKREGKWERGERDWLRVVFLKFSFFKCHIFNSDSLNCNMSSLETSEVSKI